MRVSRTVVATVAMQDDYMKGSAAAVGSATSCARGHRDPRGLRRDHVLASALGPPRLGPDEFISTRLVPRLVSPSGRANARSIRLAGTDWLLASGDDPPGAATWFHRPGLSCLFPGAALLPRARIVDVPPDWGDGDPRVQAVMERHATDARPQPAGLWLWVTLSCCPRTPTCATQPQLGFKTWFQVIHAATNETEVETTGHVVSIRVSAAGEAIGAALRRIAASCPVAESVMLPGCLCWPRRGLVGPQRQGH